MARKEHVIEDPIEDPDDPDRFTVKVDGIVHHVRVKEFGAGIWQFVYDQVYPQTCYGHPVLVGQVVGDPSVPSAVVISIIRGPKVTNHAWYTHWAGLAHSAFA